MDDSEFISLADKALDRIEQAIETSGADVDCSMTGDGVLEVECADGSKIIVNRHLAAREIWVAARAGGFHFRWSDEEWRDTRSGQELLTSLSALLSAQSGGTLTLS
ncbi:iron donor protein CyaY [Propionivibrio sp.]|uniref:iron donor protein CyaY n=1 Tax=Propionivibrio sp. TaxID=2212460 RepID=UPI00272EA20A|nr:iron donor protein CyaY [Propionivibrio sp.]